MSSVRIGEITHYFDRIGVAVVALMETIRVGDTVHILGPSTDFQQEVTSLQIEHQPIDEGGPGQEVAMRVQQRARPHDKVFKITAEE